MRPVISSSNVEMLVRGRKVLIKDQETNEEIPFVLIPVIEQALAEVLFSAWLKERRAMEGGGKAL